MQSTSACRPGQSRSARSQLWPGWTSLCRRSEAGSYWEKFLAVLALRDCARLFSWRGSEHFCFDPGHQTKNIKITRLMFLNEIGVELFDLPTFSGKWEIWIWDGTNQDYSNAVKLSTYSLAERRHEKTCNPRAPGSRKVLDNCRNFLHKSIKWFLLIKTETSLVLKMIQNLLILEYGSIIYWWNMPKMLILVWYSAEIIENLGVGSRKETNFLHVWLSVSKTHPSKSYLKSNVIANIVNFIVKNLINQ